MKKILITIFSALSLLSIITMPVSAKSVKSLPSSVTKYTWYRESDGSQGGFHDQTKFKGNNLNMKSNYNHKGYQWKLSKLKQTSKNIYYGNLNFGDMTSPVKIIVKNKYKFDVIQKHFGMNPVIRKKAYGGNENYGAIIFTRPKPKPTVPASIRGYYLYMAPHNRSGEYMQLTKHNFMQTIIQADSYKSNITKIIKHHNYYKLNIFTRMGKFSYKSHINIVTSTHNYIKNGKHKLLKTTYNKIKYAEKHSYIK